MWQGDKEQGVILTPHSVNTFHSELGSYSNNWGHFNLIFYLQHFFLKKILSFLKIEEMEKIRINYLSQSQYHTDHAYRNHAKLSPAVDHGTRTFHSRKNRGHTSEKLSVFITPPCNHGARISSPWSQRLSLPHKEHQGREGSKIAAYCWLILTLWLVGLAPNPVTNWETQRINV